MKAVSSEAPHGGMVRFLLGFDDWSFLKKESQDLHIGTNLAFWLANFLMSILTSIGYGSTIRLFRDNSLSSIANSLVAGGACSL
jgi:fluoride ion exporter CrcB/FEX